MSGLGDLVGRITQALAAMLPALLAWLAGRRGVQADAAAQAARVASAQTDIAARPDESPDALRARLRDGRL